MRSYLYIMYLNTVHLCIITVLASTTTINTTNNTNTNIYYYYYYVYSSSGGARNNFFLSTCKDLHDRLFIFVFCDLNLLIFLL